MTIEITWHLVLGILCYFVWTVTNRWADDFADDATFVRIYVLLDRKLKCYNISRLDYCNSLLHLSSAIFTNSSAFRTHLHALSPASTDMNTSRRFLQGCTGCQSNIVSTSNLQSSPWTLSPHNSQVICGRTVERLITCTLEIIVWRGSWIL